MLCEQHKSWPASAWWAGSQLVGWVGIASHGSTASKHHFPPSFGPQGGGTAGDYSLPIEVGTCMQTTLFVLSLSLYFPFTAYLSLDSYEQRL